ncbi:MAG: hypothetical protein MI741_18995, partial [Rhodospirillales bacterium]|nr:hypothetical protein [Rhodospirillales bacterium]
LWQRAEQLQPTSNDTALGCYTAAQSTEPLCALDDHRIVDQGQVTTDDDADAFTPPVKYVIERTARGRGSIIHTTPDASPAATEVLIYLTELRGATPLSEP